MNWGLRGASSSALVDTPLRHPLNDRREETRNALSDAHDRIPSEVTCYAGGPRQSLDSQHSTASSCSPKYMGCILHSLTVKTASCTLHPPQNGSHAEVLNGDGAAVKLGRLSPCWHLTHLSCGGQGADPSPPPVGGRHYHSEQNVTLGLCKAQCDIKSDDGEADDDAGDDGGRRPVLYFGRLGSFKRSKMDLPAKRSRSDTNE